MVIKRCKPLLGTFVEIEVDVIDPNENECINNAYARMGFIESKLSMFETTSDCALLNRLAFKQPVKVCDDMVVVLQKALYFFEASQGNFDVAYKSKMGSSQDIHISGNEVRFTKPLTLDLGGIAKGYAVDEAIKTLMGSNAQSGIVNAGGDIRYFGESIPDIWIRLSPNNYVETGDLTPNKALATSYPQEQHSMLSTTGLWNGKTKVKMQNNLCVTVMAPTCLDADALTKVVLIMGELSQPILEQLHAVAYLRSIEG